MPTVAVLKPIKGRLEARLPFNPNNKRENRYWLHDCLGDRVQIQYSKGTWYIPRPYFRRLVEGLAGRFGRVDVYLDYMTTQRCDRRCQEATGDDCVCSCGGYFHGGSDYQRDWIEVGETTLVSNGEVRRRHMIVELDI